jgi:hypothetical protein
MGPSPFPNLEQIQPNGIKSLLSTLNPLKATGPDNISGRFLKELTPALTLIVQASLHQGQVPTIPPILKSVSLPALLLVSDLLGNP